MRKSAISHYAKVKTTVSNMRLVESIRTLPKPGLFGWIALTILWTLIPAAAQMSPGPLSRAHQSINGVTDCTT